MKERESVRGGAILVSRFQTAYLDEGNAVVKTLLDEKRLLAILLGLLALVGSDSLGLLVQTSLLLLLGLWLVLVQETEELGGGVLVEGV